MLSIDKYRDNNNFIRLNTVETSDKRLNVLTPKNNFNFTDIDINPIWVANVIERKQNVSTDGYNYDYETDFLYFGSYYFVSGQMVEHSRQLYNLLDLLADFGGFFTLVTKMFMFLGLMVNTRVHAASMLHEMFYLKLSSKKKTTSGMWKDLKHFTSNLYEINFSQRDLMTEVKQFFAAIFCC